MINKEFANIMNNAKDLTIGQVFKIITHLKFKTVAAVVAFFVAIVSGSFVIGRYSYQEKTALTLDSPFGMRLLISEKQYEFKNLILMEDPINLADNSVILTIREIQNAFDIVPIGKIVARKEKIELPGVFGLFNFKSIGVAKASEEFNWNGHENDMNFKEVFIDSNTINRYYEDGCILEYKVCEDRKSNKGSFRWIQQNH